MRVILLLFLIVFIAGCNTNGGINSDIPTGDFFDGGYVVGSGIYYDVADDDISLSIKECEKSTYEPKRTHVFVDVKNSKESGGLSIETRALYDDGYVKEDGNVEYIYAKMTDRIDHNILDNNCYSSAIVEVIDTDNGNVIARVFVTSSP